MKKNNNSKPLSEELASRRAKLKEEDAQVRALIPRPEAREAACRPGLPYDKVIAAFLDVYSERPALGERAYEILKCKETGRSTRSYTSTFNTIPYGELHNRIKSLAMAWRSNRHCRVERDDFVCIMGFSGIDYAVIDMACAYAKAVTVPLSATSPQSDIQEILQRVQPVVLAARAKDAGYCAALAVRTPSIKCIVAFEYDAEVDEDSEALRKAQEVIGKGNNGICLHVLDDLIAYGSALPFSFLQTDDNENDKLAMIMHSSGSTGKQKGACVAAKALINTWQSEDKGYPRITLVMLPLNHNMGRNELYGTLSSGGTAYFTARQDMSTYFEDIRLVRPTSLVFIPRILDLIYQYFQMNVAKRLALSSAESRESVEKEVKSEMNYSFLGERLLSGAVASAPVSSEVKQFIIECFGIELVDGYSTTETASGGLAIDGKVNHMIVLDYRLSSVSELGYHTTDKPFPRGEFCVKTKFGITEYFRQPDATAQLFDEDGYCRTGDIVEEYAPGHIAIIDRKTNVVKLAQGEYVALGNLGKLFEADSALIRQIYVYGSAQIPHVLAVVVPDVVFAREMLSCTLSDDSLRDAIKSELYAVGRRHSLKNFEIPHDFIIEKNPFSSADGLLSPLNKYLVPALRRKYGPKLEELYREHEQERLESIERFPAGGSFEDITRVLAGILQIFLRIETGACDEHSSFYELGGDSLAAALFSLHIEEAFGVNIGGDAILSPTGNIRTWASSIQSALHPDSVRPSFRSIHGDSSTVLHRDDLRLERFLDPVVLDRAISLPLASKPPRTVVLTGGTGFLGRALCLDALESLSRVGGKLVCIVRAHADKDARRRLEGQFFAADKRLWERYHAVSDCLEVLAGDISRPLLGLEEGSFTRLANEADAICHAGALVNHRLEYRHLFNPNVLGVCGAIQLAITGRRKAIDFISTIGVNELLQDPYEGEEQAGLRPSIELSSRYAAGYIASKWAGEQLLLNAHQAAEIPVTIFRCDFILPDRRYEGQFNANDMLTRLLYSVIVTKLAPRSFYRLRADEDFSQAHFGGVPVDVLSEAIVHSLGCRGNELRVYNALNVTQQGISLDTFLGWLQNAGYQIDRSLEYADWLVRIESALQRLHLDAWRHSIADILDAFREPFAPEVNIPSCSNFKALIEGLGNAALEPFVSEAYFHDYCRWIKQLHSG